VTYTTCRAVCYFECGHWVQQHDKRMAELHSTNVQEEAGSKPPTNKRRVWKMVVELRRCSLLIEPVDAFVWFIRTWLEDTCCNWSICFPKEGASERLGVSVSSDLPHFWGKLLALSLAEVPLWASKWVKKFLILYHGMRRWHSHAWLNDWFPFCGS